MATITVDRAVLEQALEAWSTASYSHPTHHKAMLLAMTALRQALEAEQHRPVSPELEAAINKAIAEPVQAEPVAWNEPTPDFYISELSRNTIRYHNAVHGKQEFSKQRMNDCVVPVWFTAAPQRTWVGLTDEEWEAMYDKFAKYQEYGAFVSGWEDFARAIEQALKDKNHG